jgi:phosphate transport system substrate-binding protein
VKASFLLAGLLASLCSCSEKPEEMIGPTIGSLNIIADENLRELISQEEQIFERTYKYAQLNIQYAPSNDVFNHFLKDSVDAIIVSRFLHETEKAWLQSQERIPREYPFARSALAFIQHKENPDSNRTYENLLSQLRNADSGQVFVLENMRSGIPEELLGHMQVDTMPSHIFAVPGQDGVLEYVLQNRTATGIIDWSDLSDSDLTYARTYLEKVRVIGIRTVSNSATQEYITPYQYNLTNYPFARDLLLISTTGRTDVSKGFSSFLCGEVGQKIILKAGLLPLYQTERLVELKEISDMNIIE